MKTIKVIPNVGFTSTIGGVKYRAQAGVALEMPAGADWVKAGLATPAEGEKPAPKAKAKTGKGK